MNGTAGFLSLVLDGTAGFLRTEEVRKAARQSDNGTADFLSFVLAETAGFLQTEEMNKTTRRSDNGMACFLSFVLDERDETAGFLRKERKTGGVFLSFRVNLARLW